jgi:hypothetical protein
MTSQEGEALSERVSSPLFLDGWLEFNRRRWNVTPARRLYQPAGPLPSVATVLYFDRRGRIVQPPRNPYLPFEFKHSNTTAPFRLIRQWLETAELAEQDMRRHPMRVVALPPGVADLRVWQWRGYMVGTRYTYYLEFPYSLAAADPAVRKQVRKAGEAGYTVSREFDMSAVHACLTSTERRQGFSHELSVQDLELLRDLMGDESCRVYVCRDAGGNVASARVVLHLSGTRAIDWVAGTVDEHLRGGATQFTIAKALEDLHEAQAAGFDFGGANLSQIAAAKASWGGALVSYHTLEPVGPRFLAKAVRDVARARFRGVRRNAADRGGSADSEGTRAREVNQA